MQEDNNKWMARTKLLLGETGIEKLANAHVFIIGLGGVGSYAAEAIARAGVGEMTIIDGDIVDPSNRNRQLPALYTTHGMSKALLMEERIKQINPNIKLHTINEFCDPAKVQVILKDSNCHYVIEAIDSLSPKLYTIKTCYDLKIPIVSSMGAGGKMDPTKIEVSDLYKTYNCVLAQKVRKRLKRLGVEKGIKAVFSTEFPLRESLMMTDGSNYKKSAFGTISYIPAVFGLTCASVVIRDLVDWEPVKQ
jgi:tRNA threonylcarbamoyladenosine dehydratase